MCWCAAIRARMCNERCRIKAASAAAAAAAAVVVVYSAAICAYIELNCAHLSKSMKLVHMYSTEVADQHQLLIQDRNCI